MVHVDVLHSVKPPNERTNPFVQLHVDSLPKVVRSSWFSWKRALLGSYHVIHFQWPENLLRADGRAKRTLKRAAFALLMLRLRVARTPIVVTVHNLAPHETPSHFERRMLRELHRRASALVALNDTADLSGFASAPVHVIAHGDYRQRFARRDSSNAEDGRVLFFGSIREYKNVPALIAAAAPIAGSSVIVAGQPWNTEVQRAIVTASRPYENVRLELRELSEAELTHEITRAEIVALPYSQLYNSGAIFLALTIGVPVLAPSTPTTKQLQDEVGGQWLHLYEEGLRTCDVRRALDRARILRASAARTEAPNLQARNWRDIGRKYADLYLSVAHISERE